MDDKTENTGPLAGQIELGEMLIREEPEPEEKVDNFITGQMSMDDIESKEKEEKEGERVSIDDKNNDDNISKDANQFLMDDNLPDEEIFYGNDDALIQTSFEDAYEGDLDENLSKKQEKTKKSSKKSQKNEKKHTEEFFEDAESTALRGEIESINSSFSDMDSDVGRGVFSGINQSKFDANNHIEEKVFVENSGEKIGDGLLLKNLDTVLHESMIPYSEHVILDRALPRVEDGLKPVQRRILYSMIELGFTPDKPFRKSATIVGDCLGKYHPHGDSSVYDAMVRMAQPFNSNEVLISGHGNFGSIDGDSAAAMRYTEARLAPLALELLRDLDKNTVRWGLNFDDTRKEPEMLPGRFPNLLVNGSSGIAVGLATNIPPHNLGECIDGVVAYIDNPKITLDEMMKIIKGPDFPTGAYILDNSELALAYETGRGKIYLRAKMHIEGEGTDRRSIVITEFPYQVNKSATLQKIAQMKEKGLHDLDGIAEIRDESSKEGERAVIRIKKDASLAKIYNSLLKYTDLQGTFGINMVAIAGGKPRQMGLMDIISYYSEYQREIILRRSKYDLEQAKEREHILSGLIIAIKNIDAVVKIIKTSESTTEAKKRLREKFVLSERQAQAILDMRLARLTSLEVNKLIDEVKRLKELIKELEGIISSKKKQYNIVKTELLALKKYKRDRRTKFMKAEEVIHSEEETEEKPKEVIVIRSASGNLKAVPIKQYNMASKEMKESATAHDIHVIKCNTLSSSILVAFSNLGNCYKASVRSIGEMKYRDKGVSEYSVFTEMAKEEYIVSIIDEKDFLKGKNILIMTKMGMIKRSDSEEYVVSKRNFVGIKLKDGDEVVGVDIEKEEPHHVLMITQSGMALNAKLDDVPTQGRATGGVKGMQLTGKDVVICANVVYGTEHLLCITERGYMKRVAVSSLDESTRYRKGLKMLPTSRDSGSLYVLGQVLREEVNVVLKSIDGTMLSKSSTLVPILNRLDKGKPFDKSLKTLLLDTAFVSYI